MNRALVALGLLWFGFAGVGVAQAPLPEPRLYGEFGLAVHEADGRVTVRWMTAAPDSGLLRVIADGRVWREVATESSTAHAVSFSRPPVRSIVLEYGALSDPGDWHRTAVTLGNPARAAVASAGSDSIFVLGDIHGEFDRLVTLLRNAEMIDSDLQWTGGRRQLVILGDVMDRGADVTRALWFLYRLEKEAAEVGGAVHLLLGNHEIMVMAGDLRYLHPKEQFISDRYGIGYTRLYDPRESVLGRWLATKPAIARVGRVLFAHGGVTPEHLAYSLASHSDSLSAYMGEELFSRWSDSTYEVTMDSAAYVRRHEFFWGENSAFWNRGYVQSEDLGGELERVLRHFEADLLVVGHTPVPEIQARYRGALIAAHPRHPAGEMLLVVREGDGYSRFRHLPAGPPVPLPPPI